MAINIVILGVILFGSFLFIHIKLQNMKRLQYKKIQKQRMFFERQLEYQLYHYDTYKKQTDEIRKFKHDFKSHQIVLERLLKNKAYDAVEAYVEQLGIYAETNQHEVDFENYVIDALICFYREACKEKGIKLEVLGQVSTTVGITDLDLCVLLGNLLENAMEAVEKIIYERCITLRVYIKNNTLCINIRNYYEHTLTKIKGKYHTTKATKGQHGVGIESISEIVAGYGGVLQIDDRNQVFHVKVTIPLQEKMIQVS
ncbi:MAG: ATP-binding protein [Cellulosilyticaceae bacterium]